MPLMSRTHQFFEKLPRMGKAAIIVPSKVDLSDRRVSIVLSSVTYASNFALSQNFDSMDDMMESGLFRPNPLENS
jgi:hypothetical protein